MQKKKETKTEFTYIDNNFTNIKRCFDGIVETEDGRFVTAVEVEPINFRFKTGNEKETIIAYFERWLRVAPVKFQIKTIATRTDVNYLVDRSHKAFEKLQDKNALRAIHEDEVDYIQTLGNNTGVERHFYVIIEYSPSENFVAKSDSDVSYYLNSAKNALRKGLASCGNTVITHKNDNDFMLELCFKCLNRDKSLVDMYERWDELVERAYALCDGDEEKVAELPTPYNNIVAPKTIEIRDEETIIDGSYRTFLYIPSIAYPDYIVPAWLSGIINYGEGVDIDIFVEKLDKQKIRNTIRRTKNLSEVSLREKQQKNADGEGAIRLQKSVYGSQHILDRIACGDSVYFFNILISVTADSHSDLYNKVMSVREYLDMSDIDSFECKHIQDAALRSSMPLNALDKQIFEKSKRNVTTQSLSAFYPFTSFEVTDEDGIVMGVNAENRSLCVLDIFNTKKYKNANMAILGTSGAGKTFMLSIMLKRFRMKGIQTSIIAPLKGHEFYRVCTAIGGQFIRLSSGSQSCVNIMEIRPKDKKTKELLEIRDDEDEIILNEKVDKLLTFFSLIVPDISYEEKQLLDEALIKTYKKKGITKDNNSLIDHMETRRLPNGNTEEVAVYKEMPILSDLYDVLVQSDGCQRLANILKRYTTGSASSFNGQTNVDLNNPFTVVDISSLSKELIPIGMFIALDFIYDKAQEDITQKKAIAVDEAWLLMRSSPLAANFLVEVFKIIRGYGGAAIAASQDINDFLSAENGEYGKAIISNSKTKIILNLEPNEAEAVQKTLNLSNHERKDIEMFEKGQVLVVSNSNTFTLDFIATSLETDLVTTDRERLSELAEKKRL